MLAVVMVATPPYTMFISSRPFRSRAAWCTASAAACMQLWIFSQKRSYMFELTDARHVWLQRRAWFSAWHSEGEVGGEPRKVVIRVPGADAASPPGASSTTPLSGGLTAQSRMDVVLQNVAANGTLGRLLQAAGLGTRRRRGLGILHGSSAGETVSPQRIPDRATLGARRRGRVWAQPCGWCSVEASLRPLHELRWRINSWPRVCRTARASGLVSERLMGARVVGAPRSARRRRGLAPHSSRVQAPTCTNHTAVSSSSRPLHEGISQEERRPSEPAGI